jgi:exodeoxyribonuclease VII large subunit
MTGTVEVTEDRQSLLIRFPYRPDLVEEVRALPERRWDKGGKTWRVPSRHVEIVVNTFLRHGFTMAPEVTGLLAGTEAPAATALERPAEPAADSETSLTITQLNERVRAAVRSAFPDQVWVVGEILDYDKNKHRAHVFFTLAEKRDGQVQPTARVAAVMFESSARRIAARLQQADTRLSLQDGIEIRALVRVDLYPQSGQFQIVIEDIDPAFTLGHMARTREQILAELRAKGLDRRNASLPLPPLPLRVGVLTSPESDGWNDFLRELESSGIGFDITCYAIRVQGEAVRHTMLAGLQWFASRSAEFDVLCVLRGGGSRSDLSWFDDLQLAIAIARHPLKVLCGIGHLRDQSVLDLISHSEKTPTALGRCLVERAFDAQRRLDDAARGLDAAIRSRLDDERRRLVQIGQGLHRVVHGRLAGERTRIAQARGRLGRAAEVRAAAELERLARAARTLIAAPDRAMQRAAKDLELRATRIRLLDPCRVLQRGYAMVRNRSGRVLKSVAQIRPGMPLELILRDGTVRATAAETDEHDNAGE